MENNYLPLAKKDQKEFPNEPCDRLVAEIRRWLKQWPDWEMEWCQEDIFETAVHFAIWQMKQSEDSLWKCCADELPSDADCNHVIIAAKLVECYRWEEMGEYQWEPLRKLFTWVWEEDYLELKPDKNVWWRIVKEPSFNPTVLPNNKNE